jgi:hypothetical protein
MDTRAVARCDTCQLHWGVVVTLSDVTALMGRPEDVVDSGDRRHGEYATYAKGKCRCPACRAAAASYRRKLRSRKRLEGVA